MKSAILNTGLKKIRENNGAGIWLSVTHFSLAWASEEELAKNPANPTMTELIRQSPVGGAVKGDIIYNIWQNSFAKEQYAGSYYTLDESPSKYFQYEYDSCVRRNVLKCNEKVSAGDWPSNLAPHFPFGSELHGYTNSSTLDPNDQSQLTEINMPYPLQYNDENKLKGIGKMTCLFPIKSHRNIDGSDGISEIAINYNLELPSIATSAVQETERLTKSIGNFKFNRIGLYATMCAKTEPIGTNDKDLHVPQADVEPFLFAVIDIAVDSCGGNDVRFDVFKTRDDTGFSGWDFDAQFSISTSEYSALAESNKVFYLDAIRDDATRYYQAQIMTAASMSETIMQLQMMVLQLANSIEEKTGVNPFKNAKVPGYSLSDTLGPNREYVVENTGLNNRMLLDAFEFRGVNSSTVQYANSSKALFSLKKGASDGDFFKVTIYNLDGSYYTESGNDVSWWNGKIVFASYDVNTGDKTKILEFDASNIKGMSYAKATFLFSYSVDLGRWIVESQSIIDESKAIS